MDYDLKVFENAFWQVGILPETGASVAFGRVRHGDRWLDVMRPTAPADYGNAGLCASFILAPWSNRIRDGRFRFMGREYVLEINSKDGTAIHGDVRKRPWEIESADENAIRLRFDSTAHEHVNFPFRFSVEAEYRLDGRDFVMGLTVRNADSQPMPAGFGHHPYFERALDGDTSAVELEIPCARYFELTDMMASGPSLPVTGALDFRQMRTLGSTAFDHQFTGRCADAPARIRYPGLGVEIGLLSDPIYEHIILYSPPEFPFFAVEPVTNANDGFNLRAKGVDGSGVFVLAPGESRSGTARLRAEHT